MQYVQIIQIFSLVYMLTRVTIVLADPHNATPLKEEPIEMQEAPPSLAASQATKQVPLAEETKDRETQASEEDKKDRETQASEEDKIALPLVKVAHKSSMELLQLLFVPKPIAVPTYTPLLQHMGIKFNWGGLAWGLWVKEPYYEGGMDFHFRGNMQLTVDVGYAYAKAKSLVRNATKGKYGIGALRYLIYPNAITNVYVGLAYGQSRFSLSTPYNPSESCTVHWTKLILGSECRLFKSIPSLYGGMYLGLNLLHGHKKRPDTGAYYVIPGYGKRIRNINWTPSLDCYLKWTITFLEKKGIIWQNK